MKKFFCVLGIILISISLCSAAVFVINEINEEGIRDYINAFDAVEYENQLIPSKDDAGNYYFTTDGEFRIMHLTDIHLGGGFLFTGDDKKALNAVATMISAEAPDLVVVTGDISFAVPWSGTLNNSHAHELFIALMERLGVYYTVAFGNHDSENYNFYNRSAVADIYSDESLEYCLFSRGPEDIFGECNHVINVESSSGIVTESIIVLDTNAYTEDDVFGIGWSYDRIHDDQIEWYEGVISYYGERNAERGAAADAFTPKSLLFMHIPIKEVKYAYDEFTANGREDGENTEYLGGHDGEEAPVVYSPEEDEQMFETILALGSTEALFYGHDHLNNFVLKYKGVILSYGYSVDYSAYSGIDKLGYQRGCTMITVCDGAPLDIVHENYYQDKYVSVYEKEIVDMTK